MGCCSSVKVEPQSKFSFEKTPIAEDLSVTFEHLKQIDEHALNVPKLYEESKADLASYLAKPAKNDIEIIRAFYVWVCNNISYDVESFFGGGQAANDTQNVLKRKKSVCEGYANIFQALCLSKGIKCEKISGFAKGYGYTEGTDITYNHRTNHAWNVVFAEGKWRFIETTWGSGHVDKNQRFVKKFMNFYFFTKPEYFIEEHFPYINDDVEGSKQWQLLKTPISLKEFCSNIKLTAEAHSFGIKLPQNKSEVLSINKSSDVVINSCNNPLETLSANLWDSNGQPCDHLLVIIKENDKTYKVTIRPKQTGTYHLKIYGSPERRYSEIPELVSFLLQCTAVEGNWEPYPPQHGFYGKGTDFRMRGFDPNTKLSPFYVCKDGSFSLTIKTEKNPFVSAKLCNGQGKQYEDFILLEKSNNEVFIKARLLETGYYRLTMFSELEQHGSCSEAFHILILNMEKPDIRQPYPKTFSTTTEYMCRLIAPLGRYLPSNTTVEIKMTSLIATELLVDGKVYVKGRSNCWDIYLNTGSSGNIGIFAKTDNDSSYKGVYEFLIKS